MRCEGLEIFRVWRSHKQVLHTISNLVLLYEAESGEKFGRNYTKMLGMALAESSLEPA